MHIVLLCATHRGFLFLERLLQLASEHEITVFSFPEQPWEPPFLEDIRRLADGHRFFEARQVHQVPDFWQHVPIDLMLVVSWRYLIPLQIYRQPRSGTFVFHDSLLPEYRGFSPTVWAMLNGEDQTGVTLFEMADDVDSGDIIAQQKVAIARDDTIREVMAHVTDAYLDLLAANLESLLHGTAPRYPQDHSRATFTCMRLPEDNRIDWSHSTTSIYNLIRATTAPYPGAFTTLDGRRLTIWEAKPVDEKRYVGRVPGRIAEFHEDGAIVLTGDGALRITQVQLESEPIQKAAGVLNRLSYTLGR